MSEAFALCLIGHGIANSPSPAIHEAALAASGRDGSYEIVDVAPADLPGVLHDLRGGRWRGANVTIPYKHALAAVCDELEGDAQLVGAVNTITVTDDHRLVGDNTDAAGFELGLSACRLWPLPGTRALVIGAGGAAAAVVLALSRVPVLRITVAARNINSARALVQSLSDAVDCELAIALWNEDYLERVLAAADIIVNATPAGLAEMPFTPARLQASCTVVDVRYRPRPVDLVAASHEAGLQSCDGLEMLLHQAMLSFQRWTGEKPPYYAARVALEEALPE